MSKQPVAIGHILLWVLAFCFVHHIEVGKSLHQVIMPGDPDTPPAFRATFTPVSVGEVLLPSGYSVLSTPPERWSHFRNVWSDSRGFLRSLRRLQGWQASCWPHSHLGPVRKKISSSPIKCFHFKTTEIKLNCYPWFGRWGASPVFPWQCLTVFPECH